MVITEPSAFDTAVLVAEKKGISKDKVVVIDDEAIDCIINALQTSIPIGTARHAATTCDSDSLYNVGLDHLIASGEKDWIRITDERESKTTPAVIFTTSGTSGLPKAAVHSHHAIILRHNSIAYDLPFKARRLIALHLFHPFGFLWTHFFAVRYGEPVFIQPKFQLAAFIAAVEEHQITETYLVPVMVRLILQASTSTKDDSIRKALRSLRLVGISGEAIDRGTMNQLQELLHEDACAGQLWGMAETGVIFQTRYTSGEKKYDLGSIGTITAGYEVQLRDEDSNGLILKEGDCGQLFVRGPALMLGYQGRQNDIDADGWFCTGDVVYQKGGYYFIVGRSKEIIKVRGYVSLFSFIYLLTDQMSLCSCKCYRYQVAPAEIEAVLIKHPSIADAAVMAVKLSDGVTDAPRAYIVQESLLKSQLTKEEVDNLIRSQLANYKALDGGIIFVSWIPRTITGKIARGQLSKMDTQRNQLLDLLSKPTGII